MLITVWADMLIEGEHVAAGQTVEVSKLLGQYLIGAKRATAAAAPTVPDSGTQATTVGEQPSAETASITGTEQAVLPRASKKTAAL